MMAVSTIVMNNSQEHVKVSLPIFFIYSARNIVGDYTYKSK